MTDLPHTDAPAASDFGMTDLEERLQGPDGSAIRKDAAMRLETMGARIAAAIAAGAAPDQYSRLLAMRDAVSTAARVLSGGQPEV